MFLTPDVSREREVRRAARKARWLLGGLGLSALLCGCALVQLKEPGEPLSPREQNLRQRTREFAAGFAATVQAAADQIAGATTNTPTRAAAIQWKVSASSAARRAAWRTVPMLGLVDTWALATQMADFFERGPGATVFGELGDIARTNATALGAAMDRTARSLLSRSEFERTRQFVTNYAQSFPLRSLAFQREPLAVRWVEFNEGEAALNIGTTADVVSDLADRLKVMSDQVPDELRWRLELPLGEVESSLVEMRRTLVAFDVSLQRLTTVAEASPVVVSNAVRALQTGLGPAFERFEKQWQTTLATFQQERQALARDVSAERTAITQSVETNLAAILRAMEQEVAVLLQAVERERTAVLGTVEKQRAAVVQDVDRLVRETTDRTLGHLRAMVRDVLFYLLLLTLVVLGLPFVFGFLLGRATSRAGRRAETAAADAPRPGDKPG